MSSDFALVDEIASKLESARLSVSIISIVLAKRILATAHEKHVTGGRRPVSLAASALYIACRMTGDRIRQRDIVLAAGISDIVVMKVYKLLMIRLGMTFPSDDPRKLEIKLTAAKMRLKKVLQMIATCSARLEELEAERDSLQLGTAKPEICPHCNNSIDEELIECPNCGWHPMPSCVEAYKTP